MTSSTCLTSSSPKPKGRLPLSPLLLIPFNSHTPTSNHAFPLLSFLKQNSACSVFFFYPKGSSFLVVVLISFFDKTFSPSVSLNLPFTISVTNSEFQYSRIKFLEQKPVVVSGFCVFLIPFTFTRTHGGYYCREEDNFLKYFWRRSRRIKGTAQTLGVLSFWGQITFNTLKNSENPPRG